MILNDLSRIFSSASTYGCDEIIISSLGLNRGLSLPITIPHGIDFYHSKVDIEVHGHEPIYMAFRDDIAERVGRLKTVLKFPHPWLLIISEHKAKQGKGTLFIAPPPSLKNFESMLAQIGDGAYPRPWGVLIKDRGAVKGDFQWWEARGFAVHTAGVVSAKNFFYRLRDILAEYACVASPNMSSAVVFAVSMDRAAFAIPNVVIECVEIGDYEETVVFDDFSGKIRSVWCNLLSGDPAVARAEACDLLGFKYMAPPEDLRDRLLQSIASVANTPIHLFPAGNGLLYKACVWLARRGVPVQKLFPHPIEKVAVKIMDGLGLNKLTIIRGSDFAHYGVTGDRMNIQTRKIFAFHLGVSATPGRAVRSVKEYPTQ